MHSITNVRSFSQLRFSRAHSWIIDKNLNLLYLNQPWLDQLKAICNLILRKLKITRLTLTQQSITQLITRLQQFRGSLSSIEMIALTRLLLTSYSYACQSQQNDIINLIEYYYQTWVKEQLATGEIFFTNSCDGYITAHNLKYQIMIDVKRANSVKQVSFIDSQQQESVTNINNFDLLLNRKLFLDKVFNQPDLALLALAICMIQNITKFGNYRVFASYALTPIRLEKLQQYEHSKYQVITNIDNIYIIHTLSFKTYKVITKFIISIADLQKLQELLNESSNLISLELLNSMIITKEITELKNVDTIAYELIKEHDYYQQQGL